MPVKLKRSVPLPILGLDPSKPGEFLDARGTPNCKNVSITRSELGKRIGTVSLGSSLSEQIMAINQLKVGATVDVLRLGLTKVQKLNQSTSAWNDIHYAVLTGTSVDMFDFAFPVLSGSKIIVYTNGVDNIRKWTGTGNDVDLGGSPPITRYMTAYGSYLVLAYVDSNSRRVQWPDTGDPETWGSGNAGSVDLMDDEGDITGLGLFGDFITVHKEDAIYVGYLVTTGEIFRFDRKSTGVGAIAHQTIKLLPNGLQIFLAKDGLHTFNGVTAPLVESPIMDELRESINPTYIRQSWSVIVREKDEYWLGVAIGSQTSPSTVYRYNYRTGSILKDERTNITAAFAYERTNATTWNDKTGAWDSDTTRWDSVEYLALNPTIMFGDSSGITTVRSAIYNDNGTAIDSYWESKDFTSEDFGDDEMGRLIRWNEMQLWAKGNSISVSYSIDGGLNWTAIDDYTLSDKYPTDSSPLKLYFDVVSSQIRFKFLNNTASESWTMKKFVLKGSPRELR